MAGRGMFDIWLLVSDALSQASHAISIPRKILQSLSVHMTSHPRLLVHCLDG
jgi:hypothetical protein